MADDDLLAELCGVSSAAAMDALADDQHHEDHDELVLASDAAALLAVERAVVETQAARVTAAGQSLGAAFESAVAMAKLVCEGRYADVLRTLAAGKVTDALAAREATDEHLCAELAANLEALVLAAAEPAQQLAAAYEVLFTGVALFNMYVQANYTGPAFEPAQLEDVLDMCARVLKSADSGKKAHSDALVALQVDGESPYSICEYPQFLALGRCLLHFVGNYAYSNWSVAVAEVDNEDSVTADVLPLKTTNDEVKRVLGELNTTAWWNARAAVAHARLLIAKTPSNTLWYEARRGYLTLLRSQQNKLFKDDEYLLARAYVEWGLAQHHFDKNKHGKRTFEQAKVVSGISVQLSGSMGKRTKFQQKSVAQMVLLAASKRPPQQNVEATVHAEAIAASTHADFGGKKVDDAEVNEDGLTKEEQAIQKLVQDGEATYRNVQLDQVDQDNVLLENIAFEDKTLTHQGNLQIVDQLVLLALCLDVKNSNANDGLTREEMMPYITRVLENPNNWMVYSTGLLERAWLECETSKRRERAVLQMQALVDQHTTRLTVLQNTLQAIEDAAPAHERLQFVHALAFPPRYALKRDLADRYLALGVVGSAVEMFEELEVWDEVVKCYQILDKPTRAEKVVRARLEVAPTPYMWCCLGDLTRDISHYETSWELSKKRFARAKRSLGRYFFEKGEYEAAIPHYQDSVEVNPMNTGAWFTLGAMAMRSEKWSLGLRAFTRVVQLEPDNGEAWGNIGSIHMRNDQYAEAFSVLHEALKQKRHMWQMWENYALCAMETERYGEAIYAMHQLLDLRSKHKRPVDHQILAWLVEAIVYPESLQKMLDDSEDKGDDSVADAVAIGAESDDDDDLSQLDEAAVATDATPPRSGGQYKKQLALLFGRITSIVTNNAKIWHLYAHFNDGLGRKEKARDCRLKQCRALQTAGWETDGAAVDELCRAAARLARDYMAEGTKKALYSCRLYIRGVLKKAQVDYADTEAVQLLAAALDEVNAMEAQL